MEIWGDGKQTRSFMYIDDCVEGILQTHAVRLCGADKSGSDELVTVDELVDDHLTDSRQAGHKAPRPDPASGRSRAEQ